MDAKSMFKRMLPYAETRLAKKSVRTGADRFVDHVFRFDLETGADPGELQGLAAQK